MNKQPFLNIFVCCIFLLSSFYLSGQNNCDFVIEAGEDVTYEVGNSIELSGVVSIPEDQISSVLWSPSIGLSCQECYTTITSITEDICYFFSITDTTNCTVTDTICVFVTNVNTSALQENIQEVINLYPNPVSDYLFIDLAANNLQEMEMYNEQGVLVKTIISTSNHQSIDIETLEDGIYFVKIKLDDDILIRKLLKSSP